MKVKVKVISVPYIFQVLYILCFTRPRYQEAFTGPLVLWFETSNEFIYAFCLSKMNFHESGLLKQKN